jgi:hypothetical protein
MTLISTECSSAMRAAIQLLIWESRMSEAVSGVELKYSSIRPLSKVP